MPSHRSLLNAAVTLTCLFACQPKPRFVVADATPRHALRSDAIGCWALQSQAKGISNAQSLLIKLDSVGAASEIAQGVRVVHRLDTNGQALIQDAEGFNVQDRWTADANSDSVRLVFNNGLYGSFWTLHLSTRVADKNSMSGVSRVFGDVVPEPAYPVQTATATRIQCRDTTARGALLKRQP